MQPRCTAELATSGFILNKYLHSGAGIAMENVFRRFSIVRSTGD